ncbi:MAG: leucine-rich repeat domain-containing protein, partial [Anaeroplasmataceae bacterium]|nr:leucine-rich repeat domain-containing protein [Anaeroplasmataceae bacterium]
VNLTISSTDKEILPWAFACSDGLKSITIENNLLGEHQFENCDGLERVTIPACVTEIRTHAFADCNSLTDITLEASLIGDYMFARCSNLESIVIPSCVTNEEVGVYSFASCHKLNSITIENEFIFDYMFFDCVGLEEVDVTNGKTNNLRTIGYAAFGSCDTLNKITVPFVGHRDFKLGDTPCKETLFGYIFGETVDQKSAFENIFYKLDSHPYGMGTQETLASVDDLSIAVVQRYAGKPEMKELVSEEDLISSEFATDDNTYTFYVPASLRTVIIVEEDIIGFGGMMDLRQIENVEFEQVETIQDYGFYNCISLKNINNKDANPEDTGVLDLNNPQYGKPLKTVGEYAFARCISVNKLIVSESIDNIGSYAFAYDDGLKDVTLFNKEVSDHMFYFDYSLEHVVVNPCVELIGKAAFGRCISLVELSIPFVGAYLWESDSRESLFGYIFGTNEEEGVEFELAKAHYLATHEDVTDVTFTTHGIRKTDQRYSERAQAISFYIPMSLKTVNIFSDTTIGFGAFMNTKDIENVNFDTIEFISNRAFENSDLYNVNNTEYTVTYKDQVYTNASKNQGGSYTFNMNGQSYTSDRVVYLGDSVIHIGDYAFNNCDELITVVIPQSLNSLTGSRIGDYIFANNAKIENIEFRNNTIGDYMFAYSASLAHILIPESVLKIETYAFAYSPSLVNKVENTYDEWIVFNNKVVGEYMFYGCENLVSIDLSHKEGGVELNGMETIGYGAFGSCYSLTQMTIPFAGGKELGLGEKEAEVNLFGYIFGDEKDTKADIEAAYEASVEAKYNELYEAARAQYDLSYTHL